MEVRGCVIRFSDTSPMTAPALDQPTPADPRARRPRRCRVFLVGAAAVLGLALVLFALAWRASNEDMHLPQAHYPWKLASYPALARVSEPLTVHSQTGVRLIGRFFHGRSAATIVLSGGYGGNQDEMLPVANSLHAAGFTVVTYDERGTGGSGGTGTWGALEERDLRSVVDSVARHPGVDPHAMGLFGFSIGADTSIIEAASDQRIKVVVAAGSWPSLQSYMKTRLIDAILRPSWAYSPLALELLQIRTGADLGKVRPGAFIAKISPRRIMLIDGLDDTDVTPRGTIANFRLAREPKTMWLVPGETHEGMVYPHGAATTARVRALFARTLLPSAK
jgi:pimeloyl-ACP methyl ester carboxylesterase